MLIKYYNQSKDVRLIKKFLLSKYEQFESSMNDKEFKETVKSYILDMNNFGEATKMTTAQVLKDFDLYRREM